MAFDSEATEQQTTGRTVRDRVQTGFVRPEELEEHDDSRPQVSFNAEDCADGAGGSGAGRGVRDRVQTGFVRADNRRDDGNDRSVGFDDHRADESDEEEGSPSQRFVRDRVQTGFVHRPPTTEEDEDGLFYV